MDDKMICTHSVMVSNAMQKYGGSFVKALGNAIMYADLENVKKIKEAFPEYWLEYLCLSEKDLHLKKEAL